MRLGAIDLHISNTAARALEKSLSNSKWLVPFTDPEIRELEDFIRILRVKLATARPRHG
jgi:hypothetical protein